MDTNTFDTLRLLGVESAPSQIEMVSGGSTSRHYDFEYNKDHKVGLDVRIYFIDDWVLIHFLLFLKGVVRKKS